MNYLNFIIVIFEFVNIDGVRWFEAFENLKADKSYNNLKSIYNYDNEKVYLRSPMTVREDNADSVKGQLKTGRLSKAINGKQIFTIHKIQTQPLEENTEENNVIYTKTDNVIGPSIQYDLMNNNFLFNKSQNLQRKQWQKSSNYKNGTRENKFLEVFEVVEFDHIVCTSSSGLEGTCLHEFDCQSIGGSGMGSCADGLGTCCVSLFICDSRTAAPVGWFVNPNFPSPSSERLSCTVTLDKSSNGIKQFRLDFTNFEILPPTSGSCEQDQFSVTGQDVNNVIPIICGINSGQHIYIEVGNSEGPVTLTIQTLSEESRLFSIKVTQLTATDDLAAPTGCLQYHKEDSGHLESFNYRDRSEVGIARSLGYLNNLNYAMCIERTPASCSITYTNIGKMQIVNYDTDGVPLIPPVQAGAEIYNCPSDWLLISAVRLCGERLNDGSVLQDFSLDAPVTDDGTGPIIIWFRSDGVYTGRGFKLYYQQNSCSTPTA